MNRVRKICNQRQKENDLTYEDLKKVWDSQNGECPYTGWKLELPNYKNLKTPKSASLDRISSNKGYIKDNIQFVSVIANFAKNDFDDSVMQKFCEAISEEHWRQINGS